MNSASDADRTGARRRSATLTPPMYASVFCSRISPRVHTIQFPPRRWSRGTRDPTGTSLRADVAAASRRRRHEWALSVPLVPSRAAGNSRITSPPKWKFRTCFPTLQCYGLRQGREDRRLDSARRRQATSPGPRLMPADRAASPKSPPVVCAQRKPITNSHEPRHPRHEIRHLQLRPLSLYFLIPPPPHPPCHLFPARPRRASRPHT